MQVLRCLQRRAFQWPIVWEVCDFSTYQEHATVERFSIFFKNYQVGVEVFSGCGPIEIVRISPMNPQKTGACHRLGYFYQKCGKICKFLQWFSSICSWGNVCDFLSRLKKTLGNMGWFLAKKWTYEYGTFSMACTNLSSIQGYKFYCMKTLQIFKHFDASFVLPKYPGFSEMVKISTFPDIFRKFFNRWNVPWGVLYHSP